MQSTWTGRRQAERRTVSIKAQAQFYDGTPPLDCEITDYSATGARIVFPAGYETPGAFDLFVPSRGDTRHAKLRWKTPDAIGVEFIQGKGTAEDQRLSELLVRVSKIEDELRGLKAGVVLAQASNQDTIRQITPPAYTPPEPMPSVAVEEHDALVHRVETLESSNEELLRALRQTLAMLGELRDATMPRVKVA